MALSCKAIPEIGKTNLVIIISDINVQNALTVQSTLISFWASFTCIFFKCLIYNTGYLSNTDRNLIGH